MSMTNRRIRPTGNGRKAGKKKDKDQFKLRSDIRLYTSTEQEIKSRNALNKALYDRVMETILYQHNIDMLAVLFALRDEFKFGKERLIRTLKKASAHADTMFRNKVSVDEMLDILEKETGVTEDDLSFKNEVIIDDEV